MRCSSVINSLRKGTSIVGELAVNILYIGGGRVGARGEFVLLCKVRYITIVMIVHIYGV